jgi:hypothetical protein
MSSASGKKLADDFSTALARSSSALVVLDRAHIPDALQKRKLSASNLDDSHNALEVAKELKVKAYVWDAITAGQTDIELLVEAFRIQNGKKIAGFKTTLPLTDQMKELTDARIGKNLSAGLAQPGRDGLTYPSCARCPPVEYSQRGVQHRFEGTVWLSVSWSLQTGALTTLWC